jgi:hypothetical protein
MYLAGTLGGVEGAAMAALDIEALRLSDYYQAARCVYDQQTYRRVRIRNSYPLL